MLKRVLQLPDPFPILSDFQPEWFSYHNNRCKFLHLLTDSSLKPSCSSFQATSPAFPWDSSGLRPDLWVDQCKNLFTAPRGSLGPRATWRVCGSGSPPAPAPVWVLRLPSPRDSSLPSSQPYQLLHSTVFSQVFLSPVSTPLNFLFCFCY